MSVGAGHMYESEKGKLNQNIQLTPRTEPTFNRKRTEKIGKTGKTGKTGKLEKTKKLDKLEKIGKNRKTKSKMKRKY